MTGVTQILESLFGSEKPPRTMGALEAALGLRFGEADLERNTMGHFSSRTPAGDVVGLTASYAWDVYHEEPATTLERLRSRRVLDFTVQLARGRGAIEAALRHRFGPPRSVAGQRAYDSWFVSANEVEGEACALSWYDKMPDWAVDAPDPAMRERFLLDLVAAVAGAETHDAVLRAASSPPPGSGVVFGGAWRESVSLELVPPIEALELARFLGWPNAIGESNDVHQSSWRIKIVTGAGAYGPVTAPPTYGRWNIGALLASRPSGGEVAGHPGGPTGRQRLGPKDVVRVFVIGPD